MCTKKIQSHLKMENIVLQHQGKQLLQLVLLHLSKILFCQFFGSFLYLTQKPYFLILSLKEFLKYQCFSLQREVTFVHNFLTISLYFTFVCPSTLFCSFCRRSAADLTSSFLAVTWRAGNLTLPLVSFSRRTLTTRSCPCCKATARGVNPS